MQSREQLEERVAELEKQVATLKAGGGRMRGIRRRAAWNLAGLPFYDIALGADPERGEFRGHAKGFIAIGDMATGVFAMGGLARGGGAVGEHTISPRYRDPQALAFFAEHGLEAWCGSGRGYRR
jgi:hypothetical protein